MRSWTKCAALAGMFALGGAAGGDVLVDQLTKVTTIEGTALFFIETIDKAAVATTNGIVLNEVDGSTADDSARVVIDESPKPPQIQIQYGSAAQGRMIVYARAEGGKDGKDQMPEIVYDDIDAGAEGTEWMMEVVRPKIPTTQETIVRVYLLSGDTIHLTIGGSPGTLTTPLTYSEFFKVGAAAWTSRYQGVAISSSSDASTAFAKISEKIGSTEGRAIVRPPLPEGP